jgi:hypothetical protein
MSLLSLGFSRSKRQSAQIDDGDRFAVEESDKKRARQCTGSETDVDLSTVSHSHISKCDYFLSINILTARA